MAATKVKSLLKSFKPLEAGAELGKTVSETVAKEVGIKGWEDTWAQIYGSLGQEHHGNGKTGAHAEAAHSEESHDIPTSGDLAPGEVLNLSKMKERPDVKARAESQKKKNVAPGIDYHREIATVSESSNRRQLTEMERKFAQIKDELNRMVESSNKIIQEEFGYMTVEQAPTEVGTYHINFLDWMLIAIQTARQKVEDSGAWLSAMKGKKGKKGYWGMFKKHGTSFGMSNERQVATQTG